MSFAVVDMDLFKFTVIDNLVYIIYRNKVDNSFVRLCFGDTDTIKNFIDKHINKQETPCNLFAFIEKDIAQGCDSVYEYLSKKGTFDKESLDNAINDLEKYYKKIAEQEYKNKGLSV